MSSALARRHASDLASTVRADAARAAGAARGEVYAVPQRPPWELSHVQLAVVAGEGLLDDGTSVSHWTGRVGGRGFGPGSSPPGIGAIGPRAAPLPTGGQTLETLSVSSSVEGATLWRDGTTPVMYSPSELFIAVAFAVPAETEVTGPSGSMPTQGAALLSVSGVLTIGMWNGDRLYARVIQADGSPVLVGGHLIEAGFDASERVFVAELTLRDGELELQIGGASYTAPCAGLYASGGTGLVVGGGVSASWELPVGMVTVCSRVPDDEERLELHAWSLATFGDAPAWVVAPTPTVTVPQAVPQELLSYDTRVFGRASPASLVEAASSTVVAAGIIRTRAPADAIVIEGARVNLAGSFGSRTFNAYGWSAGVGDTYTQDALTGPDGTPTSADRIQVASGGSSYSSYRIDASAGPGHAIVWARAYSGTGSAQVLLGYTGPTWVAARVALTETWQRIVVRHASDTQSFLGLADARAIGGGTTDAIDCVLDLVTHGRELYATSDIIGGSRAADVMTWDPAEVPLQLREGASVWRVHPCHGSADLAAGESRVLGSWGGSSDVLELYNDAGTRKVRAKAGGVVKAERSITWSGQQRAEGTALEVEVDAAAGTITVTGADTGDGTTTGTAWAWPSGVAFRLGGVYGGSSEIDGTIYLPARV